MDAEFARLGLEFGHHLPCRRVTLELVILVLNPYNWYTSLSRPANRKSDVSNDPITVPCLCHDSYLDINDQKRRVRAGASRHVLGFPEVLAP